MYISITSLTPPLLQLYFLLLHVGFSDKSTIPVLVFVCRVQEGGRGRDEQADYTLLRILYAELGVETVKSRLLSEILESYCENH